MRFGSLSEWLHWQEALHPNEIELGLDRVREVAQRLGVLHSTARTITVAGTNGKGSCVAALQALLLNAGLSVGAFTSPHLLRYNERIRINGTSVDDAALCRAFEKIDQARAEISLTYFEFNALAALVLFTEHKVDYQVLEVGLGGRLDAVNIIDADIAVLTTIAIDHEEWLGSDVDAIGREKAGICRTGQCVVLGDIMPESVHAALRELSVVPLIRGEDFDGVLQEQQFCWAGVDSAGRPVVLPPLPVPLLPLPSLACALQVLSTEGVLSQCRDLQAVIATLALPGRFQRIERAGVTWVLDVAHNPAGAQWLAEMLLSYAPQGRVVAVFSLLSDKPLSEVVQPLLSSVGMWCVGELVGVTRATPLQQLLKGLEHEKNQAGNTATVHGFDTIERALEMAVRQALPGDTVLVFGSFHTVAAAMKWMDISI